MRARMDLRASRRAGRASSRRVPRTNRGGFAPGAFLAVCTAAILLLGAAATVWSAEPEWGGGPLQVRWHRDAGRSIEREPVLAGDAIFVATTDRKLWRYGLTDGDKEWKRGFKENIDAGPVVFASETQGVRVFCFEGGQRALLHCLDAQNGDTIWERRVPGLHRILTTEDRLVIVRADGRWSARSIESGEEIWTRGGLGWEPPGVLYERGRLYALARADSIFAALPDSGSVVWSRAVPGRYAAPPVLLGDDLIVCTTGGVLRRLDPETGEIRETQRRAALQINTPVQVGDRVVTVSSDGVVESRGKNDRDTGWLRDLEKAVEVPAIGAGPVTLVAGQGGELMALRTSDGTVAWSFELSGRLRVPPILTKRHLVVSTTKGDVYLYEHTR